MKIKHVLLGAFLFASPVLVYAAQVQVDPVQNAKLDAIIVELKQINAQLAKQQPAALSKKNDGCVYASQNYSNGGRVDGVPAMSNRICANGIWIKQVNHERTEKSTQPFIRQ